MKKISSKKLFEINKRFDLIYKILYLENINSCDEKRLYYKKLYLNSIRTFNDFHEDDKKSAEDFDKAFLKNFSSICEKGFNNDNPIPVNKDFQLYDGAHRLSIAYILGIDVPYEIIEHSDIFDYKFFKKRGISQDLADIGALEYVIHNESAHIAQVFPIVPRCYDAVIESIFNKYGFVYYKKDIKININGLIKIKQINYGNEDWAGDINNDYRGLRNHAKECIDFGRMRVYVFVCPNLDDVINAKAEIRNIIKRGNFPIHINDDHMEAIRLAHIYFNDNAVDWINSTPYNLKYAEKEIAEEFNSYCHKYKMNKNNICISGSSVLTLYGLRKAKDIDCIALDNVDILEDGNISSHDTERLFYPSSFNNLVIDHRNNFMVNNIKYISLNNIIKFKFKRHELFKDVKDLYLMCIKKNVRKLVMYLTTILFYIPKEKTKRMLYK